MESGLTLLKQIARRIRYKALADLIGQPILITSLGQLESALEDILPAHGPLWTKPEDSIGTIAKYGLLDLQFSTSINLLTGEGLCGVQVLRENQLFLSAAMVKAVEEEFDPSETLQALAAILDELAQNQTVLKIFLATELPPMTLPEKFRFFYVAYHSRSLPSDFFPREFVVRDAYITNLPSIWLWKHLYL